MLGVLIFLIAVILPLRACGQTTLTPLGDGGLVTRWGADGHVEGCIAMPMGGLGVVIQCPSDQQPQPRHGNGEDDGDDDEGDAAGD